MAPRELARETSACLPGARSRGRGAPRRDAVHTAPGALPRAGSDAAGGAAGYGAYRNVLPHLGAQGRHAAPSRVPGPSGGLVGRAAEAGTARDVAGAFSPAAHTSLRALPSHRGQLPEFPLASNRPRRAVVEGEEVASSGHEGDSYRGVTGLLALGTVTPWLLGRQRRPRLPLAPPPLPHPPTPASPRMLLSPSQKSAQHLSILQTRAASACPALQGFWSYPPASLVFPVLRDARNLQLACGPLPGALDPGPPRVPASGSEKSPARLSGPDSPHHRRPGHFPSRPSLPGAERRGQRC